MSNMRRVLSYTDVCISPRFSDVGSTSKANLHIKYNGIPKPFKAIPLINAPMDTVCSVDMLRFLHNYGCPITVHRFFKTVHEQLDFYNQLNIRTRKNMVFLSVGSKDKWQHWIDTLITYSHDKSFGFGFLVDMANGDTSSCISTVSYIREKCPSANIMAGNIATKSGYEHLADAGANFIRVGIGGGSICTTRLATGFGIPVLTSIMDCYHIKRPNVYIVADGGIEFAGDICKAIAAGADMVMVGKILASTSMACGTKYDCNLKPTNSETDIRYIQYYGMASPKAKAIIGSSGSVEGVVGVVKFQGHTVDIFNQIIGNLKSSMTYYAGCTTWEEFRRSVKFVEITTSGLEECKTRVLLT